MILKLLPHARDAKYVLTWLELESVEGSGRPDSLSHAAWALFVGCIFAQGTEVRAA